MRSAGNSGKKISSIPVIMLTAKGGEIDKVVGLEIGADDYMTKPFSIRELLARIKARLRHSEREVKQVPELYSFGDIEIDFARFKIRRKGKESDLTSLETDILKYFIVHRGEVVQEMICSIRSGDMRNIRLQEQLTIIFLN